MNITSDVTDHAGIIAIGDIHANCDKLEKLVQYAVDQGLYIVFLGDLIDGGNRPMETLEIIARIVESNNGCAVMGNHDKKWISYLAGRSVKLNVDQLETLTLISDLGHMSDLYKRIQPIYYAQIRNTIFAHGSVPASFWKTNGFDAQYRSKFLYGHVVREKDVRGYYKRTYEWIDSIPEGFNVVVGHDRVALGKDQTTPLVALNASGGMGYFVDCGCGKKDIEEGMLTGAVFSVSRHTLQFIKFKMV